MAWIKCTHSSRILGVYLVYLAVIVVGFVVTDTDEDLPKNEVEDKNLVYAILLLVIGSAHILFALLSDLLGAGVLTNLLDEWVWCPDAKNEWKASAENRWRQIMTGQWSAAVYVWAVAFVVAIVEVVTACLFVVDPLDSGRRLWATGTALCMVLVCFVRFSVSSVPRGGRRNGKIGRRLPGAPVVNVVSPQQLCPSAPVVLRLW